MEHHYKVLLADNSKSFREAFSSVLQTAQIESRRFDARAVASAAEALALCEQEQFDMVCSAMYLADMEGPELCRNMRARKGYETVPFILFTSERLPNIMTKVLPEGITDIFLKTEFDELLNFIRRYPFGNAKLKGRVLYVEDERSVREYMTQLFNRYGLTVDAYEDADAAWLKFQQQDYDLVVSDVVLSGKMSGLVFANKIRRLSGDKGDTPILAITAFDDASRRVELFSMGVDDYVTKPALERELIARVNNLIMRRQSLLETRRLRGVAEQALAAKSDFLSSMTHELRTPLNAILGFAQLLESDVETPLNPEQLESARAIMDAGSHLLELINDILDLSRIEAGMMEVIAEPLDMAALVQSALDMVRSQAQARSVRMDLQGDLTGCTVLADSLRFKQVLINLLSNAIKYNREGGTVTVISVCDAAGKWQLKVADTGNGIPADMLKEIFQPFTRLKLHRHTSGTGIGLSISKRLTEMMGGTLQVASREGEGSTFTIELPIAKQSEAQRKDVVMKEARKPERVSGVLRVLLVDDNPINLRLMSAFVHKMRANAQVETAASGGQALVMLAANRPDVVFLDISMPDMDGYAVLKAARALPALAGLPIVAVTANAMMDDREKGLAAGFDAYVTKPVDFDELRRVLNKIQGV